MAKLKSEDLFFQKNTTPSTKVYEYFTVIGDHDFLDEFNRPRSQEENLTTVAKTITTDNKPTRYYIKVGTYGKIYNPIGMFSEGKNNKFLSKIGRKEFEFKEVNQKVFDLYTKFLTTKNLAWLNNAERELA